jgi:hypothetical protein
MTRDAHEPSTDRIAIVRGFLDLLLAGRFDDAAQYLDADLVVRSPPALPYGGEDHGPTGLADYVERLFGFVGAEQLGEPELRDAGDCVVLRAGSRFTAHATGRSADTVVTELYFVRDGRITEMDIYYKDPGAVAALA